jgi:hypothetical protein
VRAEGSAEESDRGAADRPPRVVPPQAGRVEARRDPRRREHWRPSSRPPRALRRDSARPRSPRPRLGARPIDRGGVPAPQGCTTGGAPCRTLPSGSTADSGPWRDGSAAHPDTSRRQVDEALAHRIRGPAASRQEEQHEAPRADRSGQAKPKWRDRRDGRSAMSPSWSARRRRPAAIYGGDAVPGPGWPTVRRGVASSVHPSVSTSGSGHGLDSNSTTTSRRPEG